MVVVAIAGLLASAASAYLLGYAFISPRGSFWRGKRGVWALILIALTCVPLPPQLISLGAAAGPLSSAISGGLPVDTSFLAWPASLGKTPYLVAWALSSVAALLVGMRVWRAGTPGWRGGAAMAFDSSSASRLSSMLPLSSSLLDALDTLGRVRLTPRDVERSAEEIRDLGRRFAGDLPASDGDVYALVARAVPAQVASPVTGCLLEGAGRRARRA